LNLIRKLRLKHKIICNNDYVLNSENAFNNFFSQDEIKRIKNWFEYIIIKIISPINGSAIKESHKSNLYKHINHKRIKSVQDRNQFYNLPNVILEVDKFTGKTNLQ
jgi:hypothetical protein